MSGVRVAVCGVGVDPVGLAGAEAAIVRHARAAQRGRAGRPLAVFSVNVDMIVRAARDPAFARDLAAGDLLLADGVPVLWMARALGARLPGRAAGVDLVPRLAARAAQDRLGLFLLGAAPGVGARAAARLAAAAPGLRVAGVLAPPPGFDADPAAVDDVAARIDAAGADVVLVALGAPRQERLILRLRARVRASALVAVGGALDIVAGDRPRAPAPLRVAGLEWAWRLAQEPRRLARRYLVDDAAIVPLLAAELAARARARAEARRPWRDAPPRGSTAVWGPVTRDAA